MSLNVNMNVSKAGKWICHLSMFMDLSYKYATVEGRSTNWKSGT